MQKQNELINDAYKFENIDEISALVPIKNSSNISMLRFSSISEEFSEVVKPVLCMYNAAMQNTVSRLKIIEEEFEYNNKRSPIHHVDSRLKSQKSILGKLEKRNYPLTLFEACSHVLDIAGVRIVCPYKKDVYLILNRILSQDDIMLVEIKDYIENPKQNGYRSLHIIIRIPVYFMDAKQMIPVELQIRTLSMDLWASLEHEIKYKTIGRTVEEDFTNELIECSRLIYTAEEKLEKMNSAL